MYFGSRDETTNFKTGLLMAGKSVNEDGNNESNPWGGRHLFILNQAYIFDITRATVIFISFNVYRRQF